MLLSSVGSRMKYAASKKNISLGLLTGALPYIIWSPGVLDRYLVPVVSTLHHLFNWNK